LHHRNLVLASQTAYRAYLESLLVRPTTGSGLSIATRHLIDCLDAAATHGPALTVQRVKFTDSLLLPLTEAERQQLVTQWSLGLGHDAAPVVTVGAEQAFNLDMDEDLGNFALDASATGLWLAGGRAELALHVAGTKRWAAGPRRPYHLEPNDYYRRQALRGRHTWILLAALLLPDAGQPALTDRAARTLLGTAHPALGARTYQIEISAHPSRNAAGGSLPTQQRRDFLDLVMKETRHTACVLLFHADVRRFDRLSRDRSRLAALFLDLPGPQAFHPTPVGNTGRLFASRNEHRTVLVVRGVLSGAVPPELLNDLRTEIDAALQRGRATRMPWLHTCSNRTCTFFELVAIAPSTRHCPSCASQMLPS